MSALPADERFDSTLDLLADPYGFIGRRCRRFRADAFRTRLVLRPVVCMRGPEAAEIFYAGGRFTRVGAMPPTTLRLLQDKGSVQQLDGERHRARKAMFLAMMTPGAIASACESFKADFLAAVAAHDGSPVALLDFVRPVLCRTACRFAGVPLGEGDVARRTAELASMVDQAGSLGPSVLRAMFLRRRAERWAAGVVMGARTGRTAPEGCALDVIATHRDTDGRPLSQEVAAVELLNVLRPTLAVDRFVVFAAHALHLHPEHGARIAEGDDGEAERFVQEVRRAYPFFPFVGGRVCKAFHWRGHDFAVGDRVLFDLYGTNHDPRCWSEPGAFEPDRFSRWGGSPYDFVAQGGGGFADGHRCPGEWMTIALLKCAVRLLAGNVAYEVPEQDLAIEATSAPALPRDRFVVSGLRIASRDRMEIAS